MILPDAAVVDMHLRSAPAVDALEGIGAKSLVHGSSAE